MVTKTPDRVKKSTLRKDLPSGHSRGLAILTVAMALAVVAPTSSPAPALVAQATGTAVVDPALELTGGTPQSVIVRARPGRVADARAAVISAAATIAEPLPLIDGFEASIPGHALTDIAASPAIVAITRNTVGRFEEYSYDETPSASAFVRT
jgi:hypothetical protein